MKNRFFLIVLLTAIILLIPFIAMKFTYKVNWNIFDFVVGGILLLGAGLLGDLVMRKTKNGHLRVFLLGVLILLFFLIWAELAVGLFGTPFAGN